MRGKEYIRRNSEKLIARHIFAILLTLYLAQPRAFAQGSMPAGGAGDALRAAGSPSSEVIDTANFGTVCDGRADDRDAFERAIRAAKESSGVLRVSRGKAGYTCRISRFINIRVAAGPRDQLRIVQDPDMVVLINCDSQSEGGYVRFDGSAGGWNYPTVEGGTIKCDDAHLGDQSAWALQFHRSARVQVNRVRITYGAPFGKGRANGILLDKVVSADIGTGAMNYIEGAGIAIQAQNTSNFVKIANNEIAGSKVHAIFTPDVSDGNLANNALFITGNYLELNQDAIRIGSRDADYHISGNYINDNRGDVDVTLKGIGGRFVNNSLVNNRTRSNIAADGTDIHILDNLCRNNSGGGYFIELNGSVRAQVNGNACTAMPAAADGFIRDGGTNSVIGMNSRNGCADIRN